MPHSAHILIRGEAAVYAAKALEPGDRAVRR
jgi:hypothetical protein